MNPLQRVMILLCSCIGLAGCAVHDSAGTAYFISNDQGPTTRHVYEMKYKDRQGREADATFVIARVPNVLDPDQDDWALQWTSRSDDWECMPSRNLYDGLNSINDTAFQAWKLDKLIGFYPPNHHVSGSGVEAPFFSFSTKLISPNELQIDTSLQRIEFSGEDDHTTSRRSYIDLSSPSSSSSIFYFEDDRGQLHVNSPDLLVNSTQSGDAPTTKP